MLGERAAHERANYNNTQISLPTLHRDLREYDSINCNQCNIKIMKINDIKRATLD
jgi:hypothetical protein